MEKDRGTLSWVASFKGNSSKNKNNKKRKQGSQPTGPQGVCVETFGLSPGRGVETELGALAALLAQDGSSGTTTTPGELPVAAKLAGAIGR